MSLADGKVVLVLEGGYDKQSLCECSEMCINALMNKELPSFPKKTLELLPHSSAIQDLEKVVDIQSNFFLFQNTTIIQFESVIIFINNFFRKVLAELERI